MYALQLGVETLVYIGFMGFQPYLHGYVHKHKKKLLYVNCWEFWH